MNVTPYRRNLGVLLPLVLISVASTNGLRATTAANWKFDESSGTTASDASGNGHTGTVSNATWVAGFSGNCLSFNGTSSQVTVPSSTGLDFTNKIYIAVAINFATGSTPNAGSSAIYKVLDRANSGGTSIYGLRVTAGKLGLIWNGSPLESSAVTWNLNQWYNVEVIHDGSTVTFKRDGGSIGTVSNSTVLTPSTGTLYIGRGVPGFEKWFWGKIDELLLADVPGGGGGTRTAWKWPFNNNSPFNRPIANGATYHDDANIRAGTVGVNMANTGRLVSKALSGSPSVVVSKGAAGTPGNCGTSTWPGLPVTLKVPAGISGTNPQTCPREGMLYVVDTDGHTGHSFHQFYRKTDTTADASRHFSNANTDAISGEGWAANGTKAGPSASSVCAGVGILRSWELDLGVIDRFKHTLYFTMQYTSLKSGTGSQHYTWPATSADSCADSCYTGTLRIGELLAIPKTVDINSLGLNADGLAVAWTAQNFGIYILDGAGNNVHLLAEQGSNTTRINNIVNNITAIRNQLRVVNNNTQATPGGGTSWPANLYPAPTPVP